MAYTVASIQATMPQNLAGRTLPSAQTAEYIAKTVLELTESYEFPQLQQTGPQFTLTVGQVAYPYNNFLQVADAGLEIEKIDSFFIYYNLPVTSLIAASNGQNSGIPLNYNSIKAMELELNILGLPIHWTRHEGQIYVSYAPNQQYVTYVRYRKEHPFPNRGLGTAPNDPILMPNSWQDIVEYASSERAAFDLRLYDIATNLHTLVFGDPKWERSGGKEGKPGLIFGRTSQREQDLETSAIRMRMMTRSCMSR